MEKEKDGREIGCVVDSFKISSYCISYEPKRCEKIYKECIKRKIYLGTHNQQGELIR